MLIGELPPVKQTLVFVNETEGSYAALSGSLWGHGLLQTARQSSDPNFAQIVNHIREG